MSNDLISAKLFIMKKDYDEGEFWSDDTESLASAFEEYAFLRIQQQLERYRKALEEIAEGLSGTDECEGLVNIAIEALQDTPTGETK